MKIRIMLDTGTPAPGQTRCAPPAKESIESDVRSMLELVESGHDSNVEWRALKKFYKVLCAAKQTDQVKNLKSMIEPALTKMGYPVGKGTVQK